MRRREILRAAIVLLAVAAAPLSAWSKQSQVEIAWQAARLAPSDLYRQIIRHQAAYRDGLVAPGALVGAARTSENSDGSIGLDSLVVAQARRAIQAVETHQPFRDIIYQLGVLMHHVIDANDPLLTTSGGGLDPGRAADFSRYMDSTCTRVPPLFYGLDTELQDPADLLAFVGRAIDRSRRLYPYVGKEYERIGGGRAVDHFDDRSTAFGVAAVAFSRAMSDAVVMLRFVWLEAGGADSLPREPLESGKLLKLSRRP